MSNSQQTNRPTVYLVGAGVVGRAILRAHTDAGVPVCVADKEEASVTAAVAELNLDSNRWNVSELVRVGNDLPAIEITLPSADEAKLRPMVIESIAERLDVKQAFLADAERLFGADAILCSNTSTLRISAIAEALSRPERFCGMHFFMPVDQRPAVEVIGGEKTADETIDRCAEHVRRVHKEPLAVGDGPGFVVNRLLSPYLNEALLLLGRGVRAEQIERAALAYGMPMSPLELIDLIGTRTVFDAGRVYWQSFPSRVDPSPILPALIKRNRPGRAGGRGLYDYDQGTRSEGLPRETLELCERYRRDVVVLGDDEVMRLLAVPMWIEAAIALREGVARSANQLDQAMRGGLGFDAHTSWLDVFDRLGSTAMLAAVEAWSPRTASMRAPAELHAELATASPSEALRRYARAGT